MSSSFSSPRLPHRLQPTARHGTAQPSGCRGFSKPMSRRDRLGRRSRRLCAGQDRYWADFGVGCETLDPESDAVETAAMKDSQLPNRRFTDWTPGRPASLAAFPNSPGVGCRPSASLRSASRLTSSSSSTPLDPAPGEHSGTPAIASASFQVLTPKRDKTVLGHGQDWLSVDAPARSIAWYRSSEMVPPPL